MTIGKTYLKCVCFTQLLILLCRCHRDDQSAFTLLLMKYFGYIDSPNPRKQFLNDYVKVIRITSLTAKMITSEVRHYVPDATKLSSGVLMKVVSCINNSRSTTSHDT